MNISTTDMPQAERVEVSEDTLTAVLSDGRTISVPLKLKGIFKLVILDTNIVSYIFNKDTRALYYQNQIQGQRVLISFQTFESTHQLYLGTHTGIPILNPPIRVWHPALSRLSHQQIDIYQHAA